MNADAIGLMSAVFLASGVEFVEAFTIVLAMGVARVSHTRSIRRVRADSDLDG